MNKRQVKGLARGGAALTVNYYFCFPAKSVRGADTKVL
jgi:hypothetical protein